MEGAWVIEEDAGADVTRAHQGITCGLFRAPVFRHAGFRFFLLRGVGSFPRRSPVPRVLSTVPYSRALMAPDNHYRGNSGSPGRVIVPGVFRVGTACDGGSAARPDPHDTFLHGFRN